METFFNNEKTQLPCFIPVFIAIGILISFNIPPIPYQILFISIISLIIIRLFCSKIIMNLFLMSSCCMLVGILALQLRVQNVDSPVVSFEDKFVRIWGNIDNITPLEHGYRVFISKLFIAKLDKEHTPHKIRLTVRTNLSNVKIGDRVKLSAILNKPMEPYLQNSYNFARDAYFKQIGAVGYSVSSFEVVKAASAKSWVGKLNIMRSRGRHVNCVS
jgi:competence protein ComEC